MPECHRAGSELGADDTPRDDTVTLSLADANVLQYNRNRLQALPHPDEVWRFANVPWNEATHAQITNTQIVEKAGHLRTSDNRHYWKTNPDAYRRLQRLLDKRDHVHSCGHSGLVNLGNDTYTCSLERCTARYDRATVTEAYFG